MEEHDEKQGMQNEKRSGEKPKVGRRKFITSLTQTVFLTAGVIKLLPVQALAGGSPSVPGVPRAVDNGCTCGTLCYTNGGYAGDSACGVPSGQGSATDEDCGMLTGGLFGGGYQDSDCSVSGSDNDCGVFRGYGTGGGYSDEACAVGGTDSDCGIAKGLGAGAWADDDCVPSGGPTDDFIEPCYWSDICLLDNPDEPDDYTPPHPPQV